MAIPLLTVRIDWAADGDFTDTFDSCAGRVLDCSWTRGASADFSSEATGACTILLDNFDDRYTGDAPGGIPKAQLVPGRPVHVYATYSATDYPRFFGYIERLSYNQADRTVTVTCYDPLRRYQETDVVVPAGLVARTAREMRIAVLSDLERGDRNLVHNPSFETNLSGWDWTTYGAGSPSLTRITTDHAGTGTACAQWVATNTDNRLVFPIRNAPLFFAGQTYRLSMYVKTPGGTGGWDWAIGLFTDVGAGVDKARYVWSDPTWQRVTMTFTVPVTVRASSNIGLTAFVQAKAPGTLLVDKVSVTRGQALYPYDDTGSGRWPNWVGNGSFDGGSLDGWYDGWANLVTNPSFETNTTGWTATTDAFINTTGTLARVTGSGKYGTCHATITCANPGGGARFAMPGTLKAGVSYRASIWFRFDGSGTAGVTGGIGSNGTPADVAQLSLTSTAGAYRELAVTWTPSADRTDAHLWISVDTAGTLVRIDGASVFWLEGASIPAYSDTGPGGGGSPATRSASAYTAKYGTGSMKVVTPAVANAGLVYDFNHLGAYFVAGQPYTASVWVNPSSVMPYKLGFAANKGDGTFDEASVTGTTAGPAGFPRQLTVTWTPSADRSSFNPLDVVLYLYQTDATARDIYIDGVRVIPGPAADDFEMAHWDLAAEPDVYLESASFGGSALSALTTLNGLTLSRHFIRPTMTSPFYEYVVTNRSDAKTSAETFNDDIQDFSAADIDRASIVNIIPMTWSGGSEIYSDAVSVGNPAAPGYGPRPGASIDGAAFWPDWTVPEYDLGPTLLARYSQPRARPTMRTENRFPSVLQRGLDDLVTVNFGRLLLSGVEFLILREDVAVSEAGNRWVAVYQLEEAG